MYGTHCLDVTRVCSLNSTHSECSTVCMCVCVCVCLSSMLWFVPITHAQILLCYQHVSCMQPSMYASAAHPHASCVVLCPPLLAPRLFLSGDRSEKRAYLETAVSRLREGLRGADIASVIMWDPEVGGSVRL